MKMYNLKYKDIGVYGFLAAFPIGFVYIGALFIEFSKVEWWAPFPLLIATALFFLHIIFIIGVYKKIRFLLSLCFSWLVLIIIFLNIFNGGDAVSSLIVMNAIYFWLVLLPIIKDMNITRHVVT